VDHIRPVSRGGGNHRDNLQPMCAPCNMAKGARYNG
jgi:5-methylcytosine-specific restriction endonuclease McrA